MAELPLQVPPLFSIGDMRGRIARDIIGWEDLQMPPTAGAGISALVQEAYLDTPWRCPFFSHTQNDSLSFAYQMSHRWEPGTLIRPHLHVIPMVAPAVAQNAFFEGQYAWCSPTRALPANVGWTTFTVTLTIPTTLVLGVEMIVDLTGGVGLTPPADIAESDILAVFIQRSGTNPLDTYSTNKPGPGTAAANLALVSFDCHIQIQKAGTQTELHG